jgi:hypothetical protein
MQGAHSVDKVDHGRSFLTGYGKSLEAIRLNHLLNEVVGCSSQSPIGANSLERIKLLG